MRVFHIRRTTCRDCKKEFEYRVPGRQPIRCKACRYQHKLRQFRLYNRGYREKQALPSTNGHYPPLAETDFPVFSRGWFKAQLEAGLTPEAMAFGSRRKLAYIKAELQWMPKGAA